jgi:hypothetical protein
LDLRWTDAGGEHVGDVSLIGTATLTTSTRRLPGEVLTRSASTRADRRTAHASAVSPSEAPLRSDISSAWRSNYAAG